MPDLYTLLKQFHAIGGIEKTGQSGFCLLMALWWKSNELGWINQFTMTNTELLYRAGFNSEKHLWDIRNRLDQLGFIKYVKPTVKKKPGIYILNFDLLNLANKLPQVNYPVNINNTYNTNSDSTDDTPINAHARKTDPDEELREYTKNIFFTSRELYQLTDKFSGMFGKNGATRMNHYICKLSRMKTDEGYLPAGSDYEEIIKLLDTDMRKS